MDVTVRFSIHVLIIAIVTLMIVYYNDIVKALEPAGAWMKA
jgi:phosphate starvation-inducible membrane PsiE